ncbi:TPA: hNH endonuclease [Escherichia coli]|nr:hNH endonuclease [Escherichia coli]HCW1469335.1 hNH endonuclease [Escherichia coli]
MKQMSLIEMDGFLKGQCIPSDLKVNETNAEYLVRKFGELESKLETALRECRSAGITIDNLEAKCAALAAENAGLKSGAMDEIKVINRGGQAYCVKDGVQVNPMYARGWNDYRAKSLQSDTPATDAFLSEIERKAIRKFINSIEHILRDKLSPYDTEEMLEAMRIFLEEQGGEQK